MPGLDVSSHTRRYCGVNRLRTICNNMLCFATCIPAYARFHLATRNVRRCQTRRLRILLRANRKTEYGRAHNFTGITQWDDFRNLPLTSEKDYHDALARIITGNTSVLTKDPVRILQPTSGTSSAPKLIPHTASSAREFQLALAPWIVDLFLQRPQLFLGSQYWSISPATELKDFQDSRIPVGFLDDSEYFGKPRRWLMDGMMAVPSIVRHIPDIAANQYVTLQFLLRARDLRLISVWHPSFLTVLLKHMHDSWGQLLADLEMGGIDSTTHMPANIREELEGQLPPAPVRANELKSIRSCRDIWPDLQIISCWAEGNVAAETDKLKRLFPKVLIQPKGLLATEGVVSIPVGPTQQHVCAITSHVLEFQDDKGSVHPAWDVTEGQSYRVILTTGGGLYRYQLTDRVQVTGFYRNTPCIRFLGRAGVVSDHVGEKLSIEHVEDIISNITSRYLHEPRFAMLVLSAGDNAARYNLLLEASSCRDHDLRTIAVFLETGLRNNYHYLHARELGQLDEAAVTLIAPNAQDRFRDFMIKNGALAGTVKYPALCTTVGVEKHLIGTRENDQPVG